MKFSKRCVVVAAIVAFAAVGAAAEGGGGLEYGINLGGDILSRIGIEPKDPGVFSAPTGDLHMIGGSGYGVDRYGYKTGGFGMGFWTSNNAGTIYSEGPVSFAGGVGGMVTGYQGNLGPIVLALNGRIGAGGYAYQSSAKRLAGFMIHAGADAEVGLAFLSWMMVSGFAGATVDVLFGGSQFLTPLVVPQAGIRVTWGDFR